MKRTLLFLFILIPAVCFAEAKLTLSKSKLSPGEKFTVQYSINAPVKPSFWIGIIPSDIPHGKENQNDAHDVAYQYTPAATGSVDFEAPVVPGAYDLRWSGDGAELTSISLEVIAVDYKPSLKLAQTTFNPGDNIDLQFSVAAQLPKSAWLGIIPSDIPHGKAEVNDQHDVDYQYVGEKTSETLHFRAPEKPGSWDFRLNNTSGNGTEIASVTFQVATVKLEGTLKLQKDVYAPGENIELAFTAPEALSPTAWVGIIPSDISHGKEDVNDQHDIQYAYLEKKGSGSLHFVAPPEQGSYDFRMNSSDSNGVEITSVTFKVSGSLNADSMAKAIAEKGKVTLYGIQFDFNQANIKPESESVLKEVADLLKQEPDLKLGIQGHTDNVGKPAYNKQLSQKRADAVKDYLVQHFQIDAARLTTEGFGDTHPIAKNDTDQGRAQNRRVELAKE